MMLSYLINLYRDSTLGQRQFILHVFIIIITIIIIKWLTYDVGRFSAINQDQAFVFLFFFK